MSGLKMLQCCSVVMGESCRNDKVQSATFTKWHYIHTFTQRTDRYFSPCGIVATLCIDMFICSSLVVLRRWNSAWREVFTVPQCTQGRLIGWGQQGGGAVSQSAHAGDRLLCDWIRNWLDWYCRACCSWGGTQKTCGIKFNQECPVCVAWQCLRQSQECF